MGSEMCIRDRVQRTYGSHLGQSPSRAARQTAIRFRNAGCCSSGRMVRPRALGSMEDVLETRTITAPDRCHRSRLDHRVCSRPARNRVLVQCSPDRSRTADHHPTIRSTLFCPYVDQHQPGSPQLLTRRGRARRSGRSNPWAHRGGQGRGGWRIAADEAQTNLIRVISPAGLRYRLSTIRHTVPLCRFPDSQSIAVV